MYMYSMQLNLPQLINLLLRYMYRSFSVWEGGLADRASSNVRNK